MLEKIMTTMNKRFRMKMLQKLQFTPIEKFHQKCAQSRHHHHKTNRTEISDSFSLQKIFNQNSRFCKQRLQGKEKTCIHMKYRMWYIMQKIMSINAVFVGILTTIRAEISLKNLFAVFTFLLSHTIKCKNNRIINFRF